MDNNNINNLPNGDDGEYNDIINEGQNITISFYDDNDEKNFQHFHRELFILSIFNAHYISWIRNQDCHQDFDERIASILIQVVDIYRLHLQDIRLLQWLDDCDENRSQFLSWLFHHSIESSFYLERELQLKIDDITIDQSYCEFDRSKRFLIYADYDDVDGSGGNRNKTEHLGHYLGHLDFVKNSSCKLRIPVSFFSSEIEKFPIN